MRSIGDIIATIVAPIIKEADISPLTGSGGPDTRHRFLGSSRAVINDIDQSDLETVSVGFFRYREKKGAPWQPLRVMRESGTWVVLLNGAVVPGSGAKLARDVPFLLWRSPFHQISEGEYDRLLAEHANAPPGHPLRSPREKVDFRAAPPVYGGKTSD